MYNKAIQDAIAGALGLKAEEFAKGWASDEEVELTIPEGRFLTIEQEETLKDNHGKTRYDAGATASREMQLKEMVKSVGIEDSIKDPMKFLDVYKENILKEANLKPNEKISELETSIGNLQKTIETKDADYLRLQSEVTAKKLRFDIQSFIPDIPDSFGISKEDATNLFFINHEVKEDGVYKNGSLLKDNLEKPLTNDQAVKDFISERKWDVKPSGRGGGASGGGSGTGLPTTMEEYESTLKEKGLAQGSAEANALLYEIAEKNPEILD